MYVDIKWYNSIIDPTNNLNPIKRIIEYKYQILDTNFRKENKYFYVNSQIETDNGIIFDVKKVDYLFQLKSTEEDIGMKNI